MNSCKGLGQDGLPAELYKALCNESWDYFQNVMAMKREKEEMPPYFCDAMIIV